MAGINSVRAVSHTLSGSAPSRVENVSGLASLPAVPAAGVSGAACAGVEAVPAVLWAGSLRRTLHIARGHTGIVVHLAAMGLEAVTAALHAVDARMILVRNCRHRGNGREKQRGEYACSSNRRALSRRSRGAVLRGRVDVGCILSQRTKGGAWSPRCRYRGCTGCLGPLVCGFIESVFRQDREIVALEKAGYESCGRACNREAFCSS